MRRFHQGLHEGRLASLCCRLCAALVALGETYLAVKGPLILILHVHFINYILKME